jgi:NitT/TauT family transport system substrate-binding protein
VSRNFAVLFAAALLAVAAVPGGATAQTPTTLKVGYDGFSMTTGPMYYGVKTGIFKKYGLDVSLIGIQGGSALTQALVGGSVDIAQNGYTPSIAAGLAGGGVAIVGGISNKLPFQMIVKKEITSGADLKGKKIAISRYGSSTDTAATFALEKLGLKRTDVVLLQLGSEGPRTAALMSGQIDASLEQYPMTGEMIERGYPVLLDVTPIAGDYPNTAYVVSRAYLAKNADAVKRFLMGQTESIKAYKSDPKGAMKLTAEFLSTPENSILQKAYERYCQDVFPDYPEFSLKGIQLVLDELKATVPQAATAKPEQFVDGTIIDALKKDNFLATLK